MMKAKKYILFLLVLGSLMSCINDDFNSNELNNGELNRIEINLEVMNQTGRSNLYSTEEGDLYNKLNENKVDRLHLFFFNNQGELDWYVEESSIIKTEHKLAIRVNSERSFRYENKVFTLIAIANKEKNIENIKTIDDLEKYQITDSTLNKLESPLEHFLMDGKVSTGIIQWDENRKHQVPATLYLKRAAAKIRLRIPEVDIEQVENGQKVTYSMEGMPEVQLINYTNTTSLLANPKLHKQEEDLKHTGYRLMQWLSFSNNTKNKELLKFNDKVISLEFPFYSFERDWSESGNKAPYLQVKINLKSGNNKPKPYYYKIPINYQHALPGMSNEEKKGLHKLKRNYLYDITSAIRVLGSDHEETPMELDATIAVQPWDQIITIPGDLQSAHYLVVKEKRPIMANIADIEIEYVSDLAIEELHINKTWYEYYEDGMNIRIENHGTHYERFIQNEFSDSFESDGFGNIELINNTSDLSKKTIQIYSPIPYNYVPFYIEFDVKQKGTSLTETVIVTQYPPKYVTGERSTGLAGGTSEPEADFRFHNPLGAGGQINDILFKITTVVNKPGELIGTPVDNGGRTLVDEISNQMISPEFIIASQHGMSQSNTPQYDNGWTGWVTNYFIPRYGPLSGFFDEKSPYQKKNFNSDFYDTEEKTYRSYRNAMDRCYNYFEGEYGMDGEYTEHYLDSTGVESSRVVKKTFKYKGRWRIPTVAEVIFIDAIQDNEYSAVKKLLQGNYYWTAAYYTSYHFSENKITNQRPVATIRCVFDTYKVSNHP